MDAKRDVATQDSSSQHKRAYIPPKLEILGSIRDLTRGPGMQGDNDNDHPPGQNKSRV